MSGSNAFEHELGALDGSNMLAFMAALGTLRLATRADRSATLRWEHRSAWRPMLRASLDRTALVGHLASELRRVASLGALAFNDNIKLTPAEFRALQSRLAALPDAEEELAMLGALASDGCVDAASKDGFLTDTAFRTMQGAGHQHFLKTIRELLASVELNRLEEELFEIWRYGRPGPTLRWDPADDRQHAFRWADPSGDKAGTVPAASALAAAALAWFPVVPRSSGLETVGFTAARCGPILSWPLWRCDLVLPAVSSLLAAAELQKEHPDRKRLDSLGVVEVMRSRRISVGKMRNFTPAWSA
jgi:hypothetical protein